jgi:hypothetical protein
VVVDNIAGNVRKSLKGNQLVQQSVVQAPNYPVFLQVASYSAYGSEGLGVAGLSARVLLDSFRGSCGPHLPVIDTDLSLSKSSVMLTVHRNGSPQVFRDGVGKLPEVPNSMEILARLTHSGFIPCRESIHANMRL